MQLLVQAILFFFCFLQSASGETFFELKPYQRPVQFSSFTSPARVMSVSAETSGKCLSVLVDVGDVIPAQGVVAELDDTFVRLDLAKNRISQEKARRQLDEEKKNLARFASLINSQSTPQATYDEAKLQADLFSYALKSLRVEEEMLNETLARYKLGAPPGWTVTRRLLEPGEFVHQGEAVLEAGDFRNLSATFQLTSREISGLTALPVIFLSFPEQDYRHPAEIKYISPLYDPVTKKIEVELRLSAAGSVPLRSGLRCILTLAGEPVDGQFVVPASSLISRYEAHWLQGRDDTRRKVILLGYLDDGSSAVVTGDGLAAGQVFTVSPQESEAR